MEYFLPDAVEAGRFKERKHSKKLTLHVGEQIIPVLEFYEHGFAVSKRYDLPNSAHIEVFDGVKSLYVGLIHYADEDADLQRFEFKRRNPPITSPPKDYFEGEVHIAGLIAKR